jgi:N12 class adenine-specific DNA methylase
MTERERLAHLKSLSDNSAKRVQSSKTEWREFLRFYAKTYKYPFPEALLIYEQAPHFTACGEIEHWNAVGRRVHRGTRGIPIINNTDKSMKVRFVYDVSDTYGEDRGIPRRWTLPERYMGAVVAEIESRFSVTSPTDDPVKNLKWAVEEYVRESCADYTAGLRHGTKGSRLKELDNDDLRKRFTDTVVDSVGFLVSERLGLAQGLYGDDELSLEYLRDFNTKAALYQLGVATGNIGKSVLILIAQTVKKQIKIERVRNDDGKRQIHDRGIEGGAFDDPGGNQGVGGRKEQGTAATAAGQVRQPVLGLSEGDPAGAPRLSARGDDAAGRVPRSGQGGAGDVGDTDAQIPRKDTEAEGRLHGSGAVRDGDTGSSGGNRTAGNRLQTEVTTELPENAKAEGENPPLSPSRGENRDEDRIYNKYIDIFTERVSNDEAYINACLNSDKENARIECDAAVKRVATDSFGIGDFELYKAYFDIPSLMNASFQNRIKDHVFGMTYGPLSKPPKTNTVKHRNFRALTALAPEIVSGEATYMRFTAGEAFDPLSVDKLATDRISVAHNYEQNGDLMADPDMEFVIDRDAGTMSARTYQQDNIGLYQTAEGDNGEIADERLARELDSFTRQWLSNIKAQNYRKEKMTALSRGEKIEVVYGSDGKVTAINGRTEATNAYARKLGIKPTSDEKEEETAEAPPNETQEGDFPPESVTTADLSGMPERERQPVPSRPEQRPRAASYGQISMFDTDPSRDATVYETGRNIERTPVHRLADPAEEPDAGDAPGTDDTVPETRPKTKPDPAAEATAEYKEYQRLQAANPGAVVMYLRGNVYESYGVSASTAARELGLSLIPAGIGPNDDIQMNVISENGFTAYRDALTEAGYDVVVSDDNPGGARSVTRYSEGRAELLFAGNVGDAGNAGDASDEITEITLAAPVSEAPAKPPNFRITDGIDIGGGGPKTKYRRNIDAIRLLQTIEGENRRASPEEQAILALYSGWGGIPQVFDGTRIGWRHEHEELLELLPEDEYRAAQSSVLNAHYTSIEVIDGIYAGLNRLGFRGGNILEPAMGVGNFYGRIPKELAAVSRLYGAELDSVTGRIARLLYPDADIRVQGFETADLPSGFFDAAIGNVPFGQYKLNDPKFDKYNFLIHDYFFCKTLDKVRPGGIIAFITSKGTLDKANTTARRYLAERAELLGAIRLPNTAFKASAGTEVTTDIIFLRKRDRLADAENEKWVYTGKTEDGIPLNEYFPDNPHMMLGTPAFDDRKYGGNSETTLNPDGRDLKEALFEAIRFLPENALDGIASKGALDEESDEGIPADPSVKNFCHTVAENGEIYQRVNSRMERREFAETAAERVKSMINMRAVTRTILTEQLDGCDDGRLSELQKELTDLYDAFFKRFGPINSKYNARLFGDDADFPLLSSIENLDGDSVTKAAVFTKRTIAQKTRTTHVDTPAEALPVCLNERGRIDIEFMADLCGKPHEEVTEDLRGVIFKNPVYDDPDDENNIFAGWETADEYLSGRVKDKLAAAEIAAEDNPIYAANVEALRVVQPKPLEAHEISARIGAHWIEPDDYRRFLWEKLNVPADVQSAVKVHYSRRTGEWTVDDNYGSLYSVEVMKEYGTERMDAYRLFELTLNQRNARIYDTKIVDGKEKRILNHRETVAVRDRQAKLKQEFKRWVFDDKERRERLCGVYNRLFNSERSRQYDGSHLTFPGMNPEKTLRPHQKAAVARILYGGNTLLAHVVGSGKTYIMAAAAMEMKRLGPDRKPCFVVPNYLVGQCAAEFQTLYPTANVLAATKKDFRKENRRRFCARISTGEWDAVIIGHSSFEKVPMSQERREARLKSDLDEVAEALIEAKADKGERITVKELERERKNLEYQLKSLQDAPKDDLVSFEELGVDALFVDEAHYYKNKFFFTKMNNVAGLSKAHAKKSTDMDMKCEYINERNHSPHGVVFATGTPISNSMVELFTMQSYLQREELERLGLNHFDNWAAAFGEVVSALELAPSGRGFRVRERFSKFVNLPELMNLFRLVADIQTADMLDLPVPDIMSGKPITIAVESSPELRAYTELLVKRAELIHNGAVKPNEDNMLCVTSDGRNAALDMRCIDPSLPDFEGSKVNACVRNVFEIYKETEKEKSAQMVFCDISTPKGGSGFSVYDDIREKLIGMGMKPSEIAFIHDAKTDEQKEKMFSAVRRGDIRVILGSTQKMGAGTNAQKRLIALHHLDCPYRPSDLEQRDGRIVRQGNDNKEVRLYQYVTKNSFDAYLWQIVESKARAIAQVMSGKNPSREIDASNETVLNCAEVMAIASGNPLIKRKMELEIEVQRLEILESQYRRDRYSLEDSISKDIPAQLARAKGIIKGYEADIRRRDEGTVKGKDGKPEFNVRLGKRDYTERKEAGEILRKAAVSGQYDDKVIGYFRGFEIIPLRRRSLDDCVVSLKGALTHEIVLSESDTGSMTKIENALERIEVRLNDERREAENLERRLEASKLRLARPFEQERELADALSELERINTELDIDRSADDGALLDDENPEAENDDAIEPDEEAEDEDEDEPEM